VCAQRYASRADCAGTACQGFAECLPGLFCSADGFCEAWCQVGGAACSGAEQCASFVTPLITGANEWGVCVP